VVNGGAYSVKLTEEFVGDWWKWFWGFRGLESCGEVVERENVGCYHCY
jgi:hypothetical protein